MPPLVKNPGDGEMNRTVGFAVGGGILAITVGVLVGLVIHAGQVQRASLSAPGEETLAQSSPVASSTPFQQRQTPILQRQTPTRSEATTAVNPPPLDNGSEGDVISDSSSAHAAADGTADETPTPAAPDADAAGGPCPSLAVKSSDAVGTTLFCQVDQVDRTLRWRAVVDKGGCLNQKMVGVGADRVEYRCTLDASGQNHWAAAG